MKAIFSDTYKGFKNEIQECITNFDNSGVLVYGGERNAIKTFEVADFKVNVKAFKTPNVFNQIIYRFFRKSKAQRSFEYGRKLKDLGVGTPEPIAYFERKTMLLFKQSFYVSAHIDYDLTYRELLTDLEYPNHEVILRAFTRFTFMLHQNQIHFLDHSPGNTLIQKNNGDYKFYLVDLNRMEFGPLSFETRIKNFSKLTIYKDMVRVMSDEYSKLSGEDFNKVFNLMWETTEAFQQKYHRKRRLKNKLLYWRDPR